MGKIRLFCIPYAGGSAAIYERWRKYLSSHIELHPIELAGRGKRIYEPLYKDIHNAADDIYHQIKNYLDDLPYALFGYSMGSLIAYELCHKIVTCGNKEPVHIFFSACRAPNVKSVKIVHDLPESEFTKEIIAMGGTAEEVFENRELANLLLPILRADLKISELYTYTPRKKLNSSVTLLYGRDDTLTQGRIDQWKDHTNACFTMHGIDGGHFFIHSHRRTIIDIINHIL